MNPETTNIDHVAIVGSLYKLMIQDQAGIERLARAYGRLLSFDEVMELTGWGRKKLMAKVEDRTIPMVKDGEWFIPYSAFIRAIDKYYESLQPKRPYKKSLSSRHG